jgi:hypothetical protein
MTLSGYRFLDLEATVGDEDEDEDDSEEDGDGASQNFRVSIPAYTCNY